MSKGLGVVAAAEVGATVVVFLQPRRREDGKDKGAPVIEAGRAADFVPGSVTAFPGGHFHLVRLADGGFLALSNRCSHLGCAVPWDEATKSFPCPCHGSAFDMMGNAVSPPARRALDLFAVKIEAGLVKVDTARRLQRERFERDQVADL